MNTPLFRLRSLLFLCAIGTSLAAQEKVILQDSLINGTVGTRVGGQLTAEGYKPGLGNHHVLYRVPRQVLNGYLEFEVKGFTPGLIQDAEGDADNGFFGMYDGRGVPEPIPYFDDFKYNYFRWNFHYRQNRNAFKSVINCAAPTVERLNSSYAVFPGGGELRDWFSEPTGINYSFDTTSWYKVRCEWNEVNAAGQRLFKVSIDGTTVWSTSGPYDYAPVDFRIWLGSAPGYGDKYVQLVQNIVFRNFKLVSYEGPAPRMLVTPASLDFSVVAGGTTGSQVLGVTASDGAAVGFTAVADVDWVTLTPGPGAGALTVAVDASGLALGGYRGAITVSAPGYQPATYAVNLTVTGVGQLQMPLVMQQVSGRQIQLTWSDPTGRLILERSALGSQVTWRPVEVAPTAAGPYWTVLLESDPQCEFYRLRELGPIELFK